MMKKVISLFLAVSVLCFATSALAAPAMGSAGGDLRNNVTAFPGDSSLGMPFYKQGDTISFNVSGVTSGNRLTVISYKLGGEAEGLVDSEVQYIEQVILGANNHNIEYVVRNQDSGIYAVRINDEEATAAVFYYAVGDVTATMLKRETSDVLGTPYLKLQDDNGTWSIGFLGKVTIDSADITLANIGATPGFTVTESGGETKSYAFGAGVNETAGKTVAGLEATRFADAEVSGSYSFIYGLTIYHVTDGHEENFSATTDAFITDAE